MKSVRLAFLTSLVLTGAHCGAHRSYLTPGSDRRVQNRPRLGPHRIFRSHALTSEGPQNSRKGKEVQQVTYFGYSAPFCCPPS